jgi:hypothetical protein
VRCPQCASDNPADYRFCGMCGTPLEKAIPVSEPVPRSAAPRAEEPVTVPSERASRVERFTPSSRTNGGSSLLGLNDTRTVERPAAQKPVEPPVPERHVPPERHVAHERPAIEERISPPPSGISGPSFLGLGSEPPRAGHLETSRDLNYLFEDEEQPRRSYGRFIAIMLVLAICGGLAYLQYRRGGNSWTAPWSKGPAQTPVQASQPQPGDQPNAASGANQSANNASTPAPGQTPTADQTPNAPDKTADGSLKEKDLPPQGAATTGEQGTGAQGAAAGSSVAGGNQAAATSSSPGDSAAKDEKTSKSGDETSETASATPPAGTSAKDTGAKGAAAAKETESAAAANDNEEAAADVPAKTAKAARTKPTPQVAPANPDDALVANAEKYLYGRGVPQNCDRALISLRAAANRQNSRAQILLGSMYFTGHCINRDLPNSYRWYAQASRQSPDNLLVQKNLEMIWRTMTPAERQLATARQ